MMQRFWHFAMCGLCLLGVGNVAADYQQHPEAQAFIARMVKEHGFKAGEIKSVLAQAEKKQAILDAIARPAEKTKPWFEYRKIFLDDDRIQQGVAFWQENAETLADVSKRYGVDESIIVAIIGVETRYGRHMGGYRVVDALTTLGFDYPPRATFFLGQLEQFFLLAREQKQNPLDLKGSYAGAMGFGQFIPSSYRHFARDHDGDEVADIWGNKQDAIASVANYFKAHGWQTGQPVFMRASVSDKVDEAMVNSTTRPDMTVAELRKKGVKPTEEVSADRMAALLSYQQEQGPEYWLGFNNFYVITRYNRSQLYAMAVWQLSEAIKESRSTPVANKDERL